MNLLSSVHHLRKLREVKPIIATAALESRALHLHYLSAELVIFSMFDVNVCENERQEMARALLSFSSQWVPGDILIDQVRLPGPNFINSEAYWLNDNMPSLSLFISGRSFLLFDILSLVHEDLGFLSRPVQTWNEDEVYQKVFTFVTNLKVVNDPAERLVKTVTERIGSVRSEERLNDTISTLEEMKRVAADFNRGSATKAEINTVLNRFLDNF